MSKVVEIDGDTFSDLAGFFETLSNEVIPGHEWGRNIDAFNDILSWPAFEDEQKYTLVCRNARISRKYLNHLAIARWFRDRLKDCHPMSREDIQYRCERALRHEGPTLFEYLVEIIRDNHEYVDLVIEE